MPLAITALTIAEALALPGDELRGDWEWKEKSKDTPAHLERHSWAMQQLPSELYLKHWSGGEPTWTANLAEAMTWLDPSIPAESIMVFPEVFGEPESLKLIFRIFVSCPHQ